MPTLADLARSFTEDAADCEDPTCRDHLMEVEPERILALLAVVEAAREHGICTCRYYPNYPHNDRHASECDDDPDLTAALAALDALEAGS